MLRKLRDLLIIAIVSFALLEVGLRIYNPIYVPLRADQIELPVNRVIKMTNLNNSTKVDRDFVNTYNAIGLRGPNFPKNPEKFIKIFTVGGSTTACVTLTDGKTWPDALSRNLKGSADHPIWLNNAGIDGHSTFGHQILLESHLKKFKPDFVVYLIGINDMGRDDLNEFDTSMIKAGLSLRNKVVAASEVLSTGQVLLRTIRAHDRGLNHVLDHDLTTLAKVVESDAQKNAYLAPHTEKYVAAYRTRVKLLVARTIEMGSQPVLVTQPALMGNAVDPTTGINMGPLVFAWGGDPASAGLKWQALELYNDVVRDVAKEQGLILIDAAREMPKDSAYYIDWFHYSNAGAQVMADLIGRGLQPHVTKLASNR